MTKMTISRRSLLQASVGLSAMAGLGLPAFAQSAPLKIGVGSDPVFAAYFVAAHEKFFADEGVEVDLQTYSDGGEAMNALVANQVDIASGSDATSIIRLSRAPLRPLAVVYQSGRYIKLAVRQEINDPKEIKKLGVVVGSTSDYVSRLMLAHFSIDPATVEIVPLGPPEAPALLARGDIDGFFIWEPWPSMGALQGGKVLLESKDVGYVDTMWATATHTAFDTRAADCAAVLRALARGAEVVRNEPERAAKAVKAVTSIPEATSLGVFKDFTAILRDFTPEDFNSYDRIAQFLLDQKVTPTLVDYRSMLQSGFFKA